MALWLRLNISAHTPKHLCVSLKTVAPQSKEKEIEAARERGDVDYARYPDGILYDFYMCTPYAAIYETKRPITLHGKRLGTAQRFTFEASPEAALLGKEFEFGLIVSDFRPSELDYCDPAEPSIHDE
jgi:hypothetical protein